jgi:lysophospholipase L1-like esterase
MLTPLAKLGLGPVLLAQARHLRRTALRLPEAVGAREGFVEGSGAANSSTVDGSAAASASTVDRPSTASAGALRVLFVGDSSAAGVGVATQAEALAEPTARALAARAGRDVHWQLVARSGINTVEALDLIRTAELRPADVLVTALGVNDVTSQRTPSQFVRDTRVLWSELQRRAGVRTWVATGLPPLHILPAAPQPLRWYLGQCARRLDRALMRWLQRLPAARFCSMQWAAEPHAMAADGFHPGPSLYARWAQAVAGLIDADFLKTDFLKTDLLKQLSADLRTAARAGSALARAPELFEDPR